jgi:hypothetical protein
MSYPRSKPTHYRAYADPPDVTKCTIRLFLHRIVQGTLYEGLELEHRGWEHSQNKRSTKGVHAKPDRHYSWLHADVTPGCLAQSVVWQGNRTGYKSAACIPGLINDR